jgi:glycosyltransferase involved in cell wall biosynthesis
VDRKNGKDKLIKTGLWFLSALKIRKIIKDAKADFIVHKEQLPFLPYILSKMKIPMLLDIGDWWWTTLFGSNKIGLNLAQTMENIEMKMLGKANNLYVSVHSRTEAKILEQRGIPGNRIRFINHPASHGDFKPVDSRKLRKELGIEKDFVVALHGIIHPSKGYDQILDWWTEISKTRKNWKLLIIGGGTGEDWCRNKIKKLGIQDSTIMTGWVKDVNTLNMYLNLADCLLVTRRNDLANQGLIPSSLFHSLSIGKPLLITGLPGFSEMVRDGIDGFAFKPDNFKSFKDKLDYIYNNPEKAKQIGKQGIKRGIDVFDPDKCAKGFYNFIDDIIKNSN